MHATEARTNVKWNIPSLHCSTFSGQFSLQSNHVTACDAGFAVLKSAFLFQVEEREMLFQALD